MLLRDVMACISSASRRAARQLRETVLRGLPGRLTWLPTLSTANPSEEIQTPPGVGTGLRGSHGLKWVRLSLLAGLFLVAAVHEVRTSAFQSWLFSHWTAWLTYTLAPGPSPRIAFPDGGPFDQRYGYTRIPEFERRLEIHGYRVTAQTRISPAAATLAALGVLPPYREPEMRGLVIRDRAGRPLYESGVDHGSFQDLDAVPPLLVNTLLFIENRRLQEPSDPRRNPVVDWGRLARAGVFYVGRMVGLSFPLEGGSTLATQLEKFRHSRDGRTASPLEKLRQMTSASLKAYREGADTRAERRAILLRYLNSLPLAAAPGWGEVNGLGNGLAAWFGMHPEEAMAALASSPPGPDTIRAYKHVLALLCATRAPTYYLRRNLPALEARVAYYTRQLQNAGVIDQEFVRRLQATPIAFLPWTATPPTRLALQQKSLTSQRTQLGRLLGEPNVYRIDRLHLQADSTLDMPLQQEVAALLDRLGDRRFLARSGLIGDHLLGGGDPRDVIYSVLLLERTPLGNLVRVHLDTLERPFDINAGMKMELGSTAKLRTLAHYLEVMAELHRQLSHPGAGGFAGSALTARDPLTRWAATTLETQPDLALEPFLQRALDRTYSANPRELFFTGGGAHTFANYDRDENGRVYTLRAGLVRSVNLVYVRLMRDLVRYHRARLPYDPETTLSSPDSPVRHRLLGEIAAAETERVLSRAYRKYRDLPSPREVETRLLGRHGKDPRRLAMLFFAWDGGAGEEALGRWLEARVGRLSPGRLRRLAQAYGNPRLTLGDFGFLLDRHPIEVWCAGELVRRPGISWSALLARSETPRRIASAWLVKTRNRRAQELRLSIRIEQDAFARMTPAWHRLGFPFQRLVPSLATALGASSDRPDALAELMGIILNDGVRLPTVAMQRLHFADGTPYETILERAPATGERVMSAATARSLRQVLAEVATGGTARRLAGAFTDAEGAIIAVGGKTGSGDNRHKTFARGGGLISSRPESRTAAFTFYIGDRYVGVITAAVTGTKAGSFRFTSALPVALLRLLAPAIASRHPPTLPPAECGPSASCQP